MPVDFSLYFNFSLPQASPPKNPKTPDLKHTTRLTGSDYIRAYDLTVDKPKLCVQMWLAGRLNCF